MQSQSMKDMGFALMAAGALLTGLVGALFYNYFQQVLSASSSAASGSSTSLASTLGIYNSTANMPIYITLAIFGFAFLITGGVFFALGNVSDLLLEQLETSRPAGLETNAPRPSRACVKCGTLLYQSVGYCPNCRSPLATPQNAAAPPAPLQARS